MYRVTPGNRTFFETKVDNIPQKILMYEKSYLTIVCRFLEYKIPVKFWNRPFLSAAVNGWSNWLPLWTRWKRVACECVRLTYNAPIGKKSQTESPGGRRDHGTLPMREITRPENSLRITLLSSDAFAVRESSCWTLKLTRFIHLLRRSGFKKVVIIVKPTVTITSLFFPKSCSKKMRLSSFRRPFKHHLGPGSHSGLYQFTLCYIIKIAETQRGVIICSDLQELLSKGRQYPASSGNTKREKGWDEGSNENLKRQCPLSGNGDWKTICRPANY